MYSGKLLLEVYLVLLIEFIYITKMTHRLVHRLILLLNINRFLFFLFLLLLLHCNISLLYIISIRVILPRHIVLLWRLAFTSLFLYSTLIRLRHVFNICGYLLLFRLLLCILLCTLI